MHVASEDLKYIAILCYLNVIFVILVIYNNCSATLSLNPQVFILVMYFIFAI